MRKEKEAKTEEKSTIRISGLLIGMAVVFILLGVLLAIIPLVTELEITALHLGYALAVILVAFGIFLIVRYFLTESYKNLQQYGFSVGAMLVVTGMIALARASVLAQYFLFTLGALMLIASIFKLQNALDLKALSDGSWGFWLAIAIAFAICAILVIINPFPDAEMHGTFTVWMILIDGIISLIGTLYLFLRLRAVKKQEEAALSEAKTLSPAEYNEETDQTEEKGEEPVPDFAGQEDFDAGIDDDDDDD